VRVIVRNLIGVGAAIVTLMMGNVTPKSHHRRFGSRFSLRRHRSSDSLKSRSTLNGKAKSSYIYNSQDELDCDVKMVHKIYKDQHSKRALEVELQTTRQQLTNVLDQLDQAKAELSSTVKELDQMRCELDSVKRDINRDMLMFTNGFKQLSSALDSLAGVQKVNKAAKKSAKWRIRLNCQCIELVPLSVAPITVKMTNFSLLRKNYEWFNHFFLSHENGYKLCLRVFPSGYEDARETSMSVFIQHLNGSHDNDLPWPMQGTIQVQLLNQVKDKHHYLSTISYNNSRDEMCAGQVTSHEANGMGEPHFIHYDDLFKTTTNKQFLRDDCVYFQISFKF